MTGALTLEGVESGYGPHLVIRGVSLGIESGTVAAW